MHSTSIIQRQESRGSDIKWADDLPPVLARIYSVRNITSAEQLQYSLDCLLSYESLRGIRDAVDLLAEALEHDWRICIVGDFDSDGATSCALAVRALRAMGASHVDYQAPNRFEYGYGLTPEIVEVVAEKRPDVIITVDNGISSIEGVASARQYGIKVLVTDHHLPGSTLPEANVIVNPNQFEDEFPSKSLAGVGVIFYVMMALRTHLRHLGWFNQREIPNLAQWLDLVAVGTVADVVPLDRNNRILIAQGLARIRANECCVGITALLKVAGRKQAYCVSNDIAFGVAPRLNAAGRLQDMSIGIECLLSDDYAHANALAERLDTLNRERRTIEHQMQIQALAHIESLELDNIKGDLPWGLCLYDPSWHQGIVGILASRIKERLHRPVIAFAQGGAETLKGSARSVVGLHIRDTLDTIAANHPGLLAKFGGHAMAAGLTIKRADFDMFQGIFASEIRQRLQQDDLRGVIHSDGELCEEEFSMELAHQLRYAGPWGQGFPEPIFDGVFELHNWRVVGEKHLKMVVRLPDSQLLLDAIAFNYEVMEDMPQHVRLAYKLDVNHYQDQQSLQLVVQHLQSI